MNKKPENMGDRELVLTYDKYKRELSWLRKRLKVFKKEVTKRKLGV